MQRRWYSPRPEVLMDRLIDFDLQSYDQWFDFGGVSG